MNKELEALERIKYKLSSTKANGYWEDLDIIETELKEHETTKARLHVLKMKIDSMMKECVDITEHTEEEDYMRTISETRYKTLQLVNDLLKEVLS